MLNSFSIRMDLTWTILGLWPLLPNLTTWSTRTYLFFSWAFLPCPQTRWTLRKSNAPLVQSISLKVRNCVCSKLSDGYLLKRRPMCAILLSTRSLKMMCSASNPKMGTTAIDCFTACCPRHPRIWKRCDFKNFIK